MSNRPTEQQLRELGIEVYQIAESIFEDCGQLRDFGIQDAGGLCSVDITGSFLGSADG